MERSRTKKFPAKIILSFYLSYSIDDLFAIEEPFKVPLLKLFVALLDYPNSSLFALAESYTRLSKLLRVVCTFGASN